MPEVTLVIAAIQAGEKILDFVQKSRDNAKQTGAWTDEESAAVDAAWAGMVAKKAWKTDEE